MPMTDARDLPLAADRQQVIELVGLADRQHPLLALAGHDLEGLHALLANVDLGQVHVHPHAALRRGLARGTGDARRSEVLDADDEAGVEDLEARLDQPLLLEGVTDLHARALVVVAVLGEPGRRQHARAADPVAAGGRAEEDGEVAEARRPGQHEALDGEHAEAEHVDEGVVLIGGIEDGLTTDGRHADRVAISGNTGHHAFGDPAAAGVVQRTKSQRIHEGDRPGSHREHIAEDPADAGGGALVGLDGGRVVVALDAEGGRDAVADVDDPGALARAHQDVRGLGGQAAQVDPGGLVRAVLRPHHGVHGQLEVVGRTPQDPGDGVGLVVGEPEGPMDRRLGGGRARTGHPAQPTRRHPGPGHPQCARPALPQ